MGRKVYVLNGGRLGRYIGTNESTKDFLNKPKCKEIISLLNKGKTVRDITGRLEVSLNLVVKVRKHHSQISVKVNNNTQISSAKKMVTA